MLNFNKFEKHIHGLKDLFLQLFTVTLGLLIALSLDNMVQSRHQRNQVHEADAAMHAEINRNAKLVKPTQQQAIKFDAMLDDDLDALIDMRTHPEQAGKSLKYNFAFSSFVDTARNTAQTAGTFGFMPYEDASEFSTIYGQQDLANQAGQQILNDLMLAMSSSYVKKQGQSLTPAEIDATIDRIGLVKARLNSLENLLNMLDKTYKDYQTKHP